MIVEMVNVTKDMKGHKILNGINFTIETPGVYGVVGRNGSGKSVLFKTIAGLLQPTIGNVKVFGELVGKGSFPKDFGALFDTPGFVPRYSALDNLKLLASIKGVVKEEEIREVIKVVGLEPDDRRPVRKYSLGMKQRLGIAQAIMEHPKLLVLDEPMNGLDESGVQEVRKVINEFKSEGTTVLLASHNREDIELLCDQVYLMEQGELRVFREDV
ncbi:ABC transporter ATP-binding protein [Edaphobacillus lindanitolerans]|uniref:ABC-2 type transport system ATP-binding protein n=1 Tax=Edaphobacillus lindanitolerans TaxID=550447 RepID=A0A1U7PM42_9BACI|nr:ABC transporter ATP-binding protein [Edaphobacillus lindanitolerans]SIT79806.1 ABC-2 type transport system ATP-binding protein [Edaphobacillus lindanitolerans]